MRDTSRPLVSVVMLSYNRPQFLGPALDSILKQTYPALEIIVVDNPSPNSSAIRAIVESRPAVTLLALLSNEGYAGGMNAGIRQAHGEYIYLTEDDMVTDPDAISTMVEYMEQDHQAGIVSGVLHDDNGTMICGGGFVHLGSVFSQFLIGRNTPTPPILNGPFCATFATGAMMMLRKATLQELGAFRSDFFMYYEDVELCQRVIVSGRTIVIVPAANAYTFAESYSVVTVREVDFHKLKNFFALHILHAPARALPEFFIRYAGINLVRALLTNRSGAALLLKAEFWTVRNLFRLWRERESMRRITPHRAKY